LNRGELNPPLFNSPLLKQFKKDRNKRFPNIKFKKILALDVRKFQISKQPQEEFGKFI
jgi:hypothetical protein